jgi:gas vesicle protein GvpL/GvpF
MSVVVYGIVEPDAPAPRVRAIDGARPRLVTCGEVGALVGDLERDELVARRRDLTAHMDVLTAALERSTVLPLRFGVVLADDDAVRRELLEPLRDGLRRALDRFENLVELRLAARYDEGALLAEIVAGNGAVRRLRASIAELDDDASVPLRVRLGEVVSAAYEERREHDAGDLRRQLGPLVRDEARGEGEDWDLVTASFLVRRADVAAFDAALSGWLDRQAGRVRAELAGPMPAYSFAEFDLAPGEPAWA